MDREPAAGPRADPLDAVHPDAEEPQLDVDLGHRAGLLPGAADRDRRGAGHALHREHLARLRLGRAHHAQRQRRLGAALRARQRRVAVLLRGLLPHLPGHLLRVLQDPARDHLDHRHADLPPDDGDRLHGLRAALGADVVLGRHRHHRPVLGDPAHRDRHPDLAARRAGGRQPDAQPLLLAALPPAVRDRRPGDRPHLGVPHHRQQQPDRRRGAAHLARPRPTRTRCRSGPTSSSRTCSRWSSCW